MLSRRQFIKVGFAGAVVFAAARFLDRPSAAPAAGRRFLDEDSSRIVAALIPVVLAGSLPDEPAARAKATRETLEAFDRAVSGLAPAIQDEIAQLFSLLGFAPSRIAFARLWQPVEAATRDDLMAFLARWRSSRFDLLRSSYHALTRLIQAAWYDNPAAWAAIGYPGPPAVEKT